MKYIYLFIYLFILSISFSKPIQAQTIDGSYIDSSYFIKGFFTLLENTRIVEKKPLGSLEVNDYYKIKFNKITFNNSDTSLTITGKVLWTSIIGVDGISIFTAFSKDTLLYKSRTNMYTNQFVYTNLYDTCNLGVSSYLAKDDSVGSTSGNFEIKFKIRPHNNLYFYKPYYYLHICDVDEIIAFLEKKNLIGANKGKR